MQIYKIFYTNIQTSIYPKYKSNKCKNIIYKNKYKYKCYLYTLK